MSSAISNNPVSQIGYGIVNGAKSIVKGAKQIHGDVTPYARAIRIIGYIFALVVPTAQMKFRSVISLTDGFAGAAQSIGSVHDLTEKTKSEDVPVLRKLADASYLAAGIGSAVELLDTVHLIDLPTVSSSTGSLGFLGKITKDAVGKAVSAVVAAACLFLGINASIKLGRSINDINNAKADNDDQALQIARMKRNEALLDLAFSVAEIAFCVLAIVQVIPAAALIMMGIASAGLGIAGFLYSKHREATEKELLAAN